jgi:hypothetical protein
MIQPASRTLAEYFATFGPAADIDFPVYPAPLRWRSAPWDDIINDEDIADAKSISDVADDQSCCNNYM